jgi:GNAT superfamily N-acetyltransferase
MTIAIRPAMAADLPLIASLIRELAEYERLLDAVRFEDADLAGNLFGPDPAAEVLVGEIDGEPQGFALFFRNFSTFEGKPGIYLEDLFVRPQARGHGLGKALISAVAAIAVQRGCARFEWAVLDWNAPAIDFYRALGAIEMSAWRVMRLEGPALARLGSFTED